MGDEELNTNTTHKHSIDTHRNNNNEHPFANTFHNYHLKNKR